MKQKLGLACALIHTPKVLFLDEPTNGVDPVSRRDFWRILYQLLREKVTIFVSTAYLDEAERCNRLGLIHRGRLLACGTPDEVKQLMRGTILEIRAAEPRRAAAVLRRAMAGDVGGPVRRPRARGQPRRRTRRGTERADVLAEAGLGIRRHPADRAVAGRRVRLGAGGAGQGDWATDSDRCESTPIRSRAPLCIRSRTIR